MASQITSLTTQLFIQAQIKKTSKLRVTGLCEENSPLTGEFPSQRASNAENVSIWWRHHEYLLSPTQYILSAQSLQEILKYVPWVGVYISLTSQKFPTLQRRGQNIFE